MTMPHTQVWYMVTKTRVLKRVLDMYSVIIIICCRDAYLLAHTYK